MNNKKTNVIPFPVKVFPSYALENIDYANEALKAHERAIKLAVLTAYLGGRDGYTENQIYQMMLAEVYNRGIAVSDHSDIKLQIKTGFTLYQTMPELTCEEVYNMAVECCATMMIN